MSTHNTLHILTTNKLPALLHKAGALVLLRDAVYLTLTELPNTDIYAIADDLVARGIDTNNLKSAQVKSINYAELVALTIRYKKSVTWK